MKKFLFSLMALVAMIGVTSCGDQKADLIGTWETGASGTVEMNQIWNINDDDTFKIQMVQNIDSIEVTLTIYGTYKLDMPYLTFDVDGTKTTCDVSAESIKNSGLSDADVKELTDIVIEDTYDTFKDLTLEVEELTPEKLEIKSTDGNWVFTKK